METVKTVRRAALSAAALLAFAGAAPASQLDPRELALGCESSLIDLDTAVLGFHYGQQPGTTMNYVSLVSSTGWQGRMWGTYGGHSVDIYYTGTVTATGGANDEHAISYTSDWDIDGASGAGFGDAIYTQDTAVRQPSFNFKIDWLHMKMSGSVSVSYGAASLTLSGTKDFPNHKMTVSGNASFLDLPLVGAAAEASLTFELDQLTGEYHSTLAGQALWGLISEEKEVNHGHIRETATTPPPVPPPRRPEPPPPYPYPSDSGNGPFSSGGGPGYTNNQVTESTPTPGSIAIVGIGICMGVRRRR